MSAAKKFFTFIKVVALIYGVSVAGLSFLIGLDAAQLTFPPAIVPHPQIFTDPSTYENRDPTELIFMMSNRGFLYTFIVPTLVVVHENQFGNITQVLIPEILNITYGPLILAPKSSIFFTLHPRGNMTNPLLQFIVMPQIWLGNWKIMEFQINTFLGPTFNISGIFSP